MPTTHTGIGVGNRGERGTRKGGEGRKKEKERSFRSNRRKVSFSRIAVAAGGRAFSASLRVHRWENVRCASGFARNTEGAQKDRPRNTRQRRGRDRDTATATQRRDGDVPRARTRETLTGPDHWRESSNRTPTQRAPSGSVPARAARPDVHAERGNIFLTGRT